MATDPTPRKASSLRLDRLNEIANIPQAFFESYMDKIRYLPERNFQLGRQMLRENKLRDAVFRFRMTLWLAPEYQPAYYYLGVAYSMMGEKAKAVDALSKSLRLVPGHPESLFTLASINPSALPKAQLPTTMPQELITDYFNNIASVYDVEQEDKGYRGHVLAVGALRQHLDTFRTNYSILDLGCGTGLCGFQASDLVRQLVGVDISRKMLELASNRFMAEGVLLYQETYHQDLRDYLKTHYEPRFDIVIAAHVFQYVGELSEVFDGIANVLFPEGIAVIQVEPYHGEGCGILLGRAKFGHSDSYVRAQAARVGMQVVEMRPVSVYPDHSYNQYILRK